MNHFRSVRRRLASAILLTISSLGSGIPLVAQTNSGFNAFESGTMGGTTGGYDNMWADSSQQRWMLNNHTHGNLPVAAWPCLAPGCIPVAGTTQIGTIYTETHLDFTNIPGVPLLEGSALPQWGATFLNLQANALVTEIGNSSSGTAANKLVVLTGAPALAQTAAAGVLQGVEGICVANCGPSATNATAQIARGGTVSCTFENTATAGDYVQIGTLTGGDCRDAGSSYPTSNGQVDRVR